MFRLEILDSRAGTEKSCPWIVLEPLKAFHETTEIGIFYSLSNERCIYLVLNNVEGRNSYPQLFYSETSSKPDQSQNCNFYFFQKKTVYKRFTCICKRFRTGLLRILHILLFLQAEVELVLIFFAASYSALSI
jgi:hypothetical protein